MTLPIIKQKISIIIPCYNEESGIGKVVKGFPRKEIRAAGYDLEIIVIDNNSTDNTYQVAEEAGARVVRERKKGKGNAIRRGFDSVAHDTSYVVMLDGDNTYRPEEILRMVEPLRSGFAEVIVGSRLNGRILNGSMKRLNHFGNWAYSQLVRIFFGAKVTDVLTGYFAWKKEVVDTIRPHLTSEGFAIEMEMVTKMARLGFEMYSVPISYHVREGESNLHPIRDGYRILMMLLRNLNWKMEEENIDLFNAKNNEAWQTGIISTRLEA